MADTFHTLQALADRADARMMATIAARTGKSDRWTLTAAEAAIPEIREATREKANADEALATYVRTAATWRAMERGDLRLVAGLTMKKGGA